MLTALSATSLAGQGAPAPWNSSRKGNWIEGCGALVIKRALDGGLWSVYRPGRGCDLNMYAEPLSTDREYFGFGGGGPVRVVRQRFILVGSRKPYHLPAWFVASVPQVFVEGHLVVAPGPGDGVGYPISATCDSAPCQASVGSNDLGWGGGTYGRIPGSGKRGVMGPPWNVPSRDSRFELVLDIGWRPDSIILPISIRAVVARPGPVSAGPLTDRAAVHARGLHGSIRTDLVAVLPAPEQGADRVDLLQDLCGGRRVPTPDWANVPAGAILLQDDPAGDQDDLLSCLRQDRAAEAWNLWRPDPGQRLLDVARIPSAPITVDSQWRFRPDRILLQDDLSPELIRVVAGALGADSVWRSDTGTIFWYVLDTPGLHSDSLSALFDQLDQIVGGGNIVPTGLEQIEPPPPRVLPDSEWHASPEVRALVHRSIRGPIRSIEERAAPSDTAVVGFTVFYGDTLRCIDLSCNYPRVSGLRVGARSGWLQNSGWMTEVREVSGERAVFRGHWPEDTALLARLVRLAARDELDWEYRGAIVELRMGLLGDPRSTGAWRRKVLVGRRAGSTDEVDSLLCLRAVQAKEWMTLVDLDTPGPDRPAPCAKAALLAARPGILASGRIPPPLLLYYALAAPEPSVRDTIASIAWRTHEWATLGVAGSPPGFNWPDSLQRALQLPSEAGAEGCVGAVGRQVESDGCNALTAFALRSGDRRLLLYLANRLPDTGPGQWVGWVQVNRMLRGDPLRARWPRSWMEE